MIFAHLPTGYVFSFLNEKFIVPKKIEKKYRKKMIYLTMLGSVFPDLDTMPFLADQGLAMHRKFITHTPFLYVVIGVAVYGWSLTMRKGEKKKWQWGLFAFLSGVFSHLLADSVLVGVRWLYPFSDNYFALVPHSGAELDGLVGLIADYLLTPYFGLEVLMFLIAFWLFFDLRYGRK